MKTINLFGAIGEGAAAEFKQALEAADGDDVTVRIDTNGGNVVEGFGIYDAVKAYAGKTVAAVESAALSIGSFITTAFDEVQITPNGYLMIHNPWTGAEGDAEEMRKAAGMLDSLQENMQQAYAERSGQTPEAAAEQMKQETWLSAQEALAAGYVDKIQEQPRSSAVAKLFPTMPKVAYASLTMAGKSKKEEPEKMAETATAFASVTDIKRAFPKASSDFIVDCLEKQLPMDRVATAAATAAMEEKETIAQELEEVKAQLQAMTEKVHAMEEEKVKAEEEEAGAQEEAEQAMEEEKTAAAKARARGQSPVAGHRPSKEAQRSDSARKRWQNAVAEYVKSGKSKGDAVIAADKAHPGLREEMIEEANAA